MGREAEREPGCAAAAGGGAGSSVRNSESSTIAAVATPPGRGAISMVRVSGAGALAAVGALGVDAARLGPRKAVLAALRRGGTALDQALVTWFPGPRSYTGEDVVEIACHGNPVVVAGVMEALLEAGVRAAGPGEFTRRAFENGRLDLTQAEAVAELIAARSDAAARSALALASGALRRRIDAMREVLLGTLAHLEAWIDFPEEDITPDSAAGMRAALGGQLGAVDELLATADAGRVLREGLRTVLAGRPNAGKSSLLNALLGRDRAIVAPEPGTTRDTVEEWVAVEGVPLHLIDTAGIRDDGLGVVERAGVERSRQALAAADLVLHVFDGSQPWGAEESRLAAECPGERTIRVANKSDLPWAGGAPEGVVRVSAVTGAGLAALRARIVERAWRPGSWGEDAVTVNARHRECLMRAREPLAAAMAGLEAGREPALLSVELREALAALASVAGAATSEDVLDKLFLSFCIGK